MFIQEMEDLPKKLKSNLQELVLVNERWPSLISRAAWWISGIGIGDWTVPRRLPCPEQTWVFQYRPVWAKSELLQYINFQPPGTQISAPTATPKGTPDKITGDSWVLKWTISRPWGLGPSETSCTRIFLYSLNAFLPWSCETPYAPRSPLLFWPHPYPQDFFSIYYTALGRGRQSSIWAFSHFWKCMHSFGFSQCVFVHNCYFLV